MNKDTLKMFNAVVCRDTGSNPIIDLSLGLVVMPGAKWAVRDIKSYIKDTKLTGKQLNKTFHKSWKKIIESSREDLLIDQILHYCSTYGSNFEDEVYIPKEQLNVPEDIRLFVVDSLTEEQLREKCLNIIFSGVALEQETIKSLLNILKGVGYNLEYLLDCPNKEVMCTIADLYDLVPEKSEDVLRLAVYKATGNTLLIKDYATLEAIAVSEYNPKELFEPLVISMATIFNRFKPIFLAFKHKCPRTVNRISKQSKKFHQPLVSNPMSVVTSQKIQSNDKHWLYNATTPALYRALDAISKCQGRTAKMYKIRNGKAWVESVENKKYDQKLLSHNTLAILSELRARVTEKKEVYIPDYVEYTVPVSEKMFVGNIPVGTRIMADRIAVGVYWENNWGVRDLDLSGLNINGKVGWNSMYSKGGLHYSGDVTTAPNGAVEYLYADYGYESDTLVVANEFNGGDKYKYRVVVGEGDDVEYEYMMNPNKVLFTCDVETTDQQITLGLITAIDNKHVFAIMDSSTGSGRVSRDSEVNDLASVALKEDLLKSLTLSEVMVQLGHKVIRDKELATEDTIDLSPSKVSKDTILSLLF